MNLRSFARALSKHAALIMPPGRAEWAQAMCNELDCIDRDATALRWAIGCVFAGYRERALHHLRNRKGTVVTSKQKLNRAGIGATFPFAIAALTVVAIAFFTHAQPSRDEGTSAHIFQLSVTLFAASILLSLATANWKQPAHILRVLAVPTAAIALAFAGVFWMGL